MRRLPRSWKVARFVEVSRDGEREVVSSRVIKHVGTDTVQVTRAIRAALEEAQKTIVTVTLSSWSACGLARIDFTPGGV